MGGGGGGGAGNGGNAGGGLAAGLYLVATPIGNLEDISLRALRVLRQAKLVAAEDTRRIRKLLNAHGITARTVSYRERNRAKATPHLLAAIHGGAPVALVSDAGTPCLSDPGAELVRLCAEQGAAVFVVPGPSAAVGALALSGFPAQRFSFLGFPPHRSAARRKLFAEVRERSEALVLFEAPHRMAATLDDLIAILGDRPAAAAREMTKLHEETLRGPLSELRRRLLEREEIRGEFTLVIAGSAGQEPQEIGERELRRRYLEMLAAGAEPNEALRMLVAKSGINRRELYRLLRRHEGGRGRTDG